MSLTNVMSVETISVRKPPESYIMSSESFMMPFENNLLFKLLPPTMTVFSLDFRIISKLLV